MVDRRVLKLHSQNMSRTSPAGALRREAADAPFHREAARTGRRGLSRIVATATDTWVAIALAAGRRPATAEPVVRGPVQ